MFTISDVIRDISIDDMPNDELKEMFEQVGPETLVKLLYSWGGLQIYLPKDGLIKWKRRKIATEFNGRNARELSRKYSVSVSWVYSIVGAKVYKKRLSNK